jgi:hypothetical protein
MGDNAKIQQKDEENNKIEIKLHQVKPRCANTKKKQNM